MSFGIGAFPFGFFATNFNWGKPLSRVSVHGVKSLDGHFAYLCRGFDFYEIEKHILIFRKKGNYFYTYNHFHSDKSKKQESMKFIVIIQK